MNIIKQIETLAERYGNPVEVEIKLQLPYRSIYSNKEYTQAFYKGLDKYLASNNINIQSNYQHLRDKLLQAQAVPK